MCLKIWSELIGNYERVCGNDTFATRMRGYVQITWRENYAKYSKVLSEKFGYEINLVNSPDLALEPEYAIIILLDGFKYGRFTGKKIADYINDSKVDFKNARRCINGLDKATHIAKLAKKYV